METVPSGKQSISWERGISGGNSINAVNSPDGIHGYPMRPRANTDKVSARNGSSIRVVQDSNTPPALPRGFDSMLKTTTETGDIGLFSIKPSRLPQISNTPRRINAGLNKDNGPQKPRRAFHPHGIPVVDDRKRLPSYMRDGSSEILSMYDSASQKSSSRGFEDQDYRSYSMTQTSSYSAYTLSNHKSYSSLRSHADGSAPILQRPRSPFAYPTRLRRPGFRPSSPALTDGGGIDYSRRAEIDRIPYGTSRNTSSPSSLYANKRLPPPLSLRPEGNRSTPSLLSQTSPKTRTPSPNLRQANVIGVQDWQHRNDPASSNTSPARSTLSLASTANLGPPAVSQSATNTPGKPSPLYYDYTEDFDVDNDSQANSEPPPQFQLQRTIHEDRPLSSALLPVSRTSGYASAANENSNHHLRTSSSSSIILRQKMRNQGPKSKDSPSHGTGHSRRSSGAAVECIENTSKPKVTSSNTIPNENRFIDLSTLGANALELSSRVSKAFGLTPSSSFEIANSDNPVDEAHESILVDQAAGAKKMDLNTAAQVLTTSGLSLNSFRTSGTMPAIVSDDKSFMDKTMKEMFVPTSPVKVADTTVPAPSFKPHPPDDPPTIPISNEGESKHQSRSSSAQGNRVRSSGFYSIGTGVNDLADLLRSFEDTSRLATAGNLNTGSRRTPMLSPTLPSESFCMSTPSLRSPTPPFLSLPKSGNDPNQASGPKISVSNVPRFQNDTSEGMITLSNYTSSDVLTFGIQVPSKIMHRSESPMLAPKPISPARQLKLKNSVPQLMKALPALPDSTRQGLAVPSKSNIDPSCNFSTLLPEVKFMPICESSSNAPLPHLSDNSEPTRDKKIQGVSSAELRYSQEDDIDEAERSSNFRPSPMKLKLKVRNSASRTSLPQESRTMNQENNYPPSEDKRPDPNPQLSNQRRPNGDAKAPKLKLRFTRAVESTSPGTVKVNKDFTDQRSANALNIRHHKDLFTPSSGFDNIFRQVSKHIHSRKASVNSDQPLDEDATEAASGLTTSQSYLNQPHSLDLSAPLGSPISASLPSPSDARSFFSDDSSHCHGTHSIRKRISNFRARVGIQYAARAGSYSCDDIVWRDQHDALDQAPAASRSITDLEVITTSSGSPEQRRSEHRLHAHRLRAKVSEWFRGARAAISARVKSKGSASRGEVQTGTSA
ncbi:hypothetical protein CJF30_00005486 [Rutstroemia sp. NJR-2017a BBW]|nr:hypothetical protein CJF30_00005898 [Rutstroemia sp. NJR-2017a BBW]PQE08598.1 hypothetical protein CJF30_00005486 [Rutstroemia sp. NJR-2017a BBW]